MLCGGLYIAHQVFQYDEGFHLIPDDVLYAQTRKWFRWHRYGLVHDDSELQPIGYYIQHRTLARWHGDGTHDAVVPH
jgi:hypothetical protein